MNDQNPVNTPKKSYFLVGQKCVVFNSEGRILLLKRSAKAGNEGTWNLLGGGLDANEDPLDGIRREAKEEAQIDIFDIQPIKLITFKENGDEVLMLAYKAKTNNPEVVLNWEHDEYKWVSKEEAFSMNISETVKMFIESAMI